MNEAVDPGLVVARFFAFGLAMLAFGAASFDLYAPARPPRPIGRIATSGLLALAAVAYAVLLTREAVGAPGWPGAGEVMMIWRDTGFGRALAVTTLAGLALTAVAASERRLPWPSAALAAIALAALAFVGHGADDLGARGAVRVIVLALHLLAIAAWLGALPALWLALRNDGQELRLLQRFGWVGGISLATVLITGTATLVFVALDAPRGLGRGYLGALAIKLAFVFALICVAAVNRFRLTPLMAREPGRARRLLRRTIVAEQLLGLGALGCVAVLGQLDPTM